MASHNRSVIDPQTHIITLDDDPGRLRLSEGCDRTGFPDSADSPDPPWRYVAPRSASDADKFPTADRGTRTYLFGEKTSTTELRGGLNGSWYIELGLTEDDHLAGKTNAPARLVWRSWFAKDYSEWDRWNMRESLEEPGELGDGMATALGNFSALRRESNISWSGEHQYMRDFGCFLEAPVSESLEDLPRRSGGNGVVTHVVPKDKSLLTLGKIHVPYKSSNFDQRDLSKRCAVDKVPLSSVPDYLRTYETRETGSNPAWIALGTDGNDEGIFPVMPRSAKDIERSAGVLSTLANDDLKKEWSKSREAALRAYEHFKSSVSSGLESARESQLMRSVRQPFNKENRLYAMRQFLASALERAVDVSQPGDRTTWEVRIVEPELARDTAQHAATTGDYSSTLCSAVNSDVSREILAYIDDLPELQADQEREKNRRAQEAETRLLEAQIRQERLRQELDKLRGAPPAYDESAPPTGSVAIPSGNGGSGRKSTSRSFWSCFRGSD